MRYIVGVAISAFLLNRVFVPQGQTQFGEFNYVLISLLTLLCGLSIGILIALDDIFTQVKKTK